MAIVCNLHYDSVREFFGDQREGRIGHGQIPRHGDHENDQGDEEEID